MFGACDALLHTRRDHKHYTKHLAEHTTPQKAKKQEQMLATATVEPCSSCVTALDAKTKGGQDKSSKNNGERRKIKTDHTKQSNLNTIDESRDSRPPPVLPNNDELHTKNKTRARVDAAHGFCRPHPD